MNSSFFIDLLVAIILITYAYDGFRRGFFFQILEFAGVFVSLYLANFLAKPAGIFLNQWLHLPTPLIFAVGFLSIWLIVQVLYVVASSFLYQKIPKSLTEASFNKAIGLVPAVVKGLLVIAITLTLLVAFPIAPTLKSAILGSHLGGRLVYLTQQAEQYLARRYQNEFEQTLTFLTNLKEAVKEEGTVALHFTVAGTLDPASEEQLVKLVNAERQKKGIRQLKVDTKLREVTRAHGLDMFARGYFGHITPEGKDPFDRMKEAGIDYQTAGENLALAPTVELAHLGLMNSPKHRENILDPSFGHVGIGVIDGGIFGKMFVQEFTN